MTLGNGQPSAGKSYRGLLRRCVALSGAKMIAGIGKIPALEGLEAQQNMGYRVGGLAFDEPARKAARGFEIAGGKLQLEGVIQNLLIFGILRKSAPVIKSRTVAIPRRAGYVTGKIAAEQGGAIDGLGARGRLALCPHRMGLRAWNGGPKTEHG